MYVSNTNKITIRHEQGGRDLIGGVVLPYLSQGLVLYGLALVARSLQGSLIFEPMTTPMPRTRYEGIQTL